MFFSSNLIRSFIIGLLGICVSIWICTSIIDENTNPFSESVLYFGGILILMSLYSPKFGLYALVFLGSYLDLFKRLIVLSIDQSFLDVTKVLAVAPLCAVATYLGMLGRIAFKEIEFKRFDFIVFSIAMLIAMVTAAANKSSGFLGALQAGVQYSCYIPLVCVLRIILNNFRELENLIKWVFGIFIPVGIYGLIQTAFGYADFERQYLLSGYTSTFMNLYEKYPRPFSTLNSTGAYTVMMGLLTVLSLGFYRYLRIRYPRKFSNFIYLLFSVFFMSCSLFSLGRVGYFVFIIGIPLTYVFMRKRLTFIFYSTGIILYIAIIIFAKEIYLFFENNQTQYFSYNSRFARIFEMGTYGDRLWSFRNITENPKLHTLFGDSSGFRDLIVSKDKGELIHEAMSESLYRVGIVGTLLILFFVGFVIYTLHRGVLRTKSPSLRLFSTACLAIFVSLLISSLLIGNLLAIYPINFYLYFLLGLIFCMKYIDLHLKGNEG